VSVSTQQYESTKTSAAATPDNIVHVDVVSHQLTSGSTSPMLIKHSHTGSELT